MGRYRRAAGGVRIQTGGQIGMDEKNILVSVNDKLGIAGAFIKTANLAIGNTEYFGPDGQGIAITLDMASEELKECQKLLSSSEKRDIV